jgi:hypothetical protein
MPKPFDPLLRALVILLCCLPGLALAGPEQDDKTELGRRTTIGLRAQTPPDLNADPATWGGLPIPIDRIRLPEAYTGPESMSGTAWVLWDQTHLYIGANVRDDRVLPAEPGKPWIGDCLQFYFDPDRDRREGEYGSDDQNWLAARLEVGTEVRRHVCPGPLKRGPLAPDLLARAIRPHPGGITYAMAIPWKELGWNVPRPGESIGFDIAVNDADSMGDVAHDTPQREMNQIEWTPGIMGGRDPSKMGTLVFADAEDLETVLAKATDLGLLDLGRSYRAAGEVAEVAVAVPSMVVGKVEAISVAVLDAEGKTVAQSQVDLRAGRSREQTPDGFVRFEIMLNLPADLPDGTYTADALTTIGDRTVRHEQDLTIATEAVSRAVSALRQAEQRARLVADQADADVQARYQTCIATARRMLSLGRLAVAKDVAEQAEAWSKRTTLDLALPATPTKANIGETLAEEQRACEGVVIHADRTGWDLRNEVFAVRLDRETFGLVMHPIVDGKPAGREWRACGQVQPTATFRLGEEVRQVPLSEAEQVIARLCASGRGVGIEIELRDFPDLPQASCRLRVELARAKPECFATVLPDDRDAACRLMTVAWPGPIHLTPEDDGYHAVPSRSGAIIPSNWPKGIDRFYPVAGYRLGHPWWAVVRDGSAMIQFVETYYDAAVKLRHVPGEQTSIRLSWQPCWGLMRYPRQVRFHFQPTGGYLTAARWYRQLLIDRGKLVPIEQRLPDQPSLEKLRGAIFLPVEIGSIRKGSYTMSNTFDSIANEVRRLRATGIDRAYPMLRHLSRDLGHNIEPTLWPPSEPAGGWAGLQRVKQACHEAGYLYGYYDCLRLFYLASRAYNEADAQKMATGLAQKLDIYGGDMAWTAPRLYPRYFREGIQTATTHDVDPDVFYFDTFVARLLEDYDPRHPATRYAAAGAIVDCLRDGRQQGMIVRVEGESIIGMKEIDMPHWSPMPDFGIPVPLTHLALHDTMVFAGWLRDFRYWEYRRLASKAQCVTCVLFGEAPMVTRHTLPFSKRNLQWARFAARVHRAIGFAEMTGHRFLNDNYTRQETTFAGGGRIVGDYDKMTVEIHGIEGIDPEPIPVASVGHDLDIRVQRFRRIDEETFEITLAWSADYRPTEPLLCFVHPRPIGNHYVEPSYDHVIRPEDWPEDGGEWTTPPMRFKLPPRMRAGEMELNVRLNEPGTKRLIYLEGIEAGNGAIRLGRITVRSKGGKRHLRFQPTSPDLSGRWLQADE